MRIHIHSSGHANLRLLLALALLSSATVAANTMAAESEYKVGVAKVDITPGYPVRLNGFGGRREESEGITQRIWAKALAIQFGDSAPAVLISIDSLGIRTPMVEEVARRLKEKFGVERDHIAVAFSHSHTTPKVNGACDTIFSSPIPPEHQAHIDRYTAELTDALEEVAVKALADRQPSKLEWAVGKVAFAKNRRTEGGPVDHDLPMLVVKSAEDDSVRAIYVTYACHCVTLSNNKISGDWSGFAQEAIERNNPGVIGLVSIGCGSDSNPESGVTGANTAAAADQGAQIADEVTRLLKGKLTPIGGDIKATFANIDLPLRDPPSREELEKAAATDDAAGYNAKFQLAKLERGEPLLTKIDYPIQSWAFGDSLTMVFLGGEICVDYSLRLKQELDASRLWLHGYSNDFCCYIPSERLLKEGGYGGGAEIVYFALPNTLQPGLEERIIKEVHRQVLPSFKSKPAEQQQSNADTETLQQALASIKVNEKYVVEIAAAEPLVADPVAIDFGPDGRLWVAEMPDYTRFADEHFAPNGSVRVLTDGNGDGRYDEAIDFAAGLRFPTDVKAWHKGVIVCDAPDVIYLEDADGNGKADVRKVLLTGFATHNAQARVNSLRWGLDNWLYGSGGLFGGKITTSTGHVVDVSDRDFRFNPDTGELQAVTGRTQPGRASDDWGNWFGCENGSLIDHYPLVDHYLARNPHVVPPATEVYVPAGKDPHQLHPIGAPTLFQLSGPPGRPTAACGLEIYRDDYLGAELANNAFVAEPVNNLVHRRILAAHRATFTGTRAPEEADGEFLASTDPWFRPVQIRTGLDGCLYVVDMHRAVIEHPKFIPEVSLRQVDVMGGREQGRIYRVRKRDTPPRAVPWLDHLNARGLALALDSPNGPQRDLAQQMLVHMKAAAAEDVLKELVRKSSRPATRMQALCTLDGLSALNAELLNAALGDGDPSVRRHAVRLSESFLAEAPALLDGIIKLVDDADPQVQMQLAYTLGEIDDPRAAADLAQLAVARHADPYLLAAVWSSVNNGNVLPLVQAIFAGASDPPATLVHPALDMLIALGEGQDLAEIAASLELDDEGAIPAWKFEAAAKLLEASRRHAKTAAGVAEQLAPAVAAARKTMEEASSAESDQLAALSVVAAVSPDSAALLPVLEPLLEPRNSPAVQRAAMKLVANIESPAAADVLLAAWRAYTPAIRAEVFDVFLGDPRLTGSLLGHITAGEIAAAELDALQRQRLLDHADESIRAEAAKALATSAVTDRAKIVSEYAAAITHGDASRGREVFGKHCASCHRLEGQGFEVGPDLAALTSRSRSVLLPSILDPNRDIDERFRSYTALTIDGLSHAGLLIAETSTSITLLEQQGKRHTLLRADLESLQNSGKSLMPEGFERDLSPRDVSDLLSYLAATGPKAKTIDGNEPLVVTPDYDGSLWLLAANAEIYGDKITYEQPFQNIGYWHGVNDYVAWSVQSTNPAEYEAYLHWACADDSAGNIFVIEGAEPTLKGKVAPTGGYDKFKTLHLGRVSLPAGASTLSIRPDGALTKPHLMDLRGLYLVPVGVSPDRALAGSAPSKGPDAATALAKLVHGLEVGTPAEYERIPKIWEEAIAAGRRNKADELVRVLDLSLPREGEPLAHWQAVVIGGGVVNGTSQQGAWPRTRTAEILQNCPGLQVRWERTLELAATMADDPAVSHGTRYDALRILGAGDWQQHGSQLLRYLKDANHELCMGAVSALSDMESEAAADALVDSVPRLDDGNRKIAVAALLRTKSRAEALQNAIKSGVISQGSLTAKQLDALAERLR
jgi:putative membrane-bound dehydrogenase-like protein